MQGVVDAGMRDLLTRMGGFSRCVTEFIRVTSVLLPDRVFQRLCPELFTDGCTPAGTPVYLQLLGSDPSMLASNAVRAVQLGALGIDLNFGCPAKTVNQSMGGSILLREPERVSTIVRAVRDAVPASTPVTVKIRLGYEHADYLQRLACGIRNAGATELAVHARTRSDGYRPPAYWRQVRQIISNGNDSSNTIINGEIWTVDDSVQAQAQSGCKHLMLGRGALAAPDLARRISTGQRDCKPLDWEQVLERVEAQFHQQDCSNPRHTGNRTKQWLRYLQRTYPEAALLFSRLRTLRDTSSIGKVFGQHRKLDLATQELDGNSRPAWKGVNQTPNTAISSHVE